MGRKYKAFISYRHLPLDADVAERLHKIIENFTIPKALRKNKEKKLGFVFRDKDELHVSSNLSRSIQEALDNSEFLIVVCSPETPKSIWVLREISYFLECHDRDHVLTVLVDGKPEDSFPNLLIDVCDEGGKLIDRIEPLGANIVADSPAKRHKLLKRESLRLLAALTGCAYDDLFRRQQRRRRRLLTIAVAICLAVVSAFISVLLLKNAQISQQLHVSQINESKVMASLSKTAYKEGDYRAALEYALGALPTESDSRPYVTEAEEALVAALNPYEKGWFEYVQSYQQDTDISALAISSDGNFFAAADSYGMVYLVDCVSGKVIWDVRISDLYTSPELNIVDQAGVVIVNYYSGVSAYAIENGTLAWETQYAMKAVSGDGEVCIFFEYLDDCTRLMLLDSKTGKIEAELNLPVLYASIKAVEINDNRNNCVLIAESYSDKPHMFFWNIEDGSAIDISAKLESVYDEPNVGADLVLKNIGNGDLLLAKVDPFGDSALICFDSSRQWEEKYSTVIETEENGVFLKRTSMYVDQIQLMDQHENTIYLCTIKHLFAYDANSGELLWELGLPDIVIDVKMYNNGSICLVLIDGTVTMCVNGILGMDTGAGYFSTDFMLSKAAFSGDVMADSTFVFVPSGAGNKATVIKKRFVDESSVIIDYEQLRDFPEIKNSPSGNLLALVNADYNMNVNRFRLIDICNVNDIIEYEFPMDYSYGIYNEEKFLSDDGKLFYRGLVIDIENKNFSGLSEDGSIPDKYGPVHAHAESPDGKILSAAVFADKETDSYDLLYWENGELVSAIPLPSDIRASEFYNVDCIEIGGNGIALISLQETWDSEQQYLVCFIKTEEWVTTELHMEGEVVSVELPQNLPYIAVAGRDSLRILNLETGKLHLSIDSVLPVQAVSKMIFVCQDRFLLVFFMAGDLAVIDTESGQIVSEISYSDLMINFSSYSHYDVFVPENQDKLYVIYDSTAYNKSLCICLDLQTMKSVGRYNGVIAYVPELDEVLVLPDWEALYHEPLLSLEDMMDMAHSILGDSAK